MMFLSSRPLLVAVAFLVASVSGHVRWSCPTPRSTNDAIKYGPCGLGNDNPGFVGSFTELRPGPLTVAFQETIRHQGSPYRIALSREGEDEYEDCILLNHIPHYDTNRGGNFYAITIDIPDVQCDNCALQLIQVMTDKIDNTECEYDVETLKRFNGNPAPGRVCHSNYHSCANVRILGSTPRNQFECSEPADWPFTAVTSNDPFIYLQQEPGIWGAVDGTGFVGALAEDQANGVTVPARFNTLVGGCGNNVNIRDNTIEAAQVPDTPTPEVPEVVSPVTPPVSPVTPPVSPVTPEVPVAPEESEEVVTRAPVDNNPDDMESSSISSTTVLIQTPPPVGGDGLGSSQGADSGALSTHATSISVISIASGILCAML